jgi:hypothetical protein
MMIKSRRLKWVERVEGVDGMIVATLTRSRRRWQENIKTYLKAIRRENVD